MFQKQTDQPEEQVQQNIRTKISTGVAVNKKENIARESMEPEEEKTGNEPDEQYPDTDLSKRKQIEEQNQGGF